MVLVSINIDQLPLVMERLYVLWQEWKKTMSIEF